MVTQSSQAFQQMHAQKTSTFPHFIKWKYFTEILLFQKQNRFKAI